MLEPPKNPNPGLMVDPPTPIRILGSKIMSRRVLSKKIADNRKKFERKRKAKGEPHRVEYFHQLDDPYSHLVAQVLERFAARYDIEITPHLVRVTGGKHQPELEKLATWARRDAELVAPHFGLSFSAQAGTVPDQQIVNTAARVLTHKTPTEFISSIAEISTAVWAGVSDGVLSSVTELAMASEAHAALDKGSARLTKMGHYSGAMFFYGGEWYWGVDRLFHLEQRLIDLDLRQDGGVDYLVPRPEIDVSNLDASQLTLHFYPSLNSPYTAIIYDRTLALAETCNVNLEHKPVLPMIMRGVPATRAKGNYIVFDTKREADFFDIPFAPFVTPIGTPTRRAYSLLAWARTQGLETRFLSTLLRSAFSKAAPLYNNKGMRKVVEEAGLDWSEASKIIGNDSWKAPTEQNQTEMVDGMGLWGVPSFRLSGPDGEPDLAVWGQDRLWLIAAEIRRRSQLEK